LNSFVDTGPLNRSRISPNCILLLWNDWIRTIPWMLYSFNRNPHPWSLFIEHYFKKHV